MGEEKNSKMRPPMGLTIQLYLLFVILVFQIWNSLVGLPNFGQPLIREYSLLVLWMSSIVDVLLYMYGLAAICKVLKGKRDSVTMLKFTLVYLVFKLGFSAFEKYGRAIPLQLLYEIPLVLFCMVFFFYLIRSKRMGEYIDKKDRRFSVSGILGVLIYFISCGTVIYAMTSRINLFVDLTRYSEDKLSMMSGEVTNGFSVFKPDPSWKCDTVILHESSGLCLFTDDSGNKIEVSTVLVKPKSRLDCSLLISSYLNARIGNHLVMEEVSHCDTVINGSTVFVNEFLISGRALDNRFLFMAMPSSETYRIFTIAAFLNSHKGREVMESGFKVMSSVDFDLKKRAAMKQAVDKVKD